MKRNSQDKIINNESDTNTGFVTVNELETILSSDLTLLNTEDLKDLFNNILNTFLRFEKNHLISRREIEDLRYKVNQSSNPNSTAEQALMSISDSDREILFDRYLLMKSEEYEQAKLLAERTKVSTLSSLNKIRFSLNTLLSDPVYGPDIKSKIQKIMLSIDPSVDFVQNVKLPSLPHGATNVSNSEVVPNEDNIILSKEVIYPNDNVSSNDDLDLNQLFK
jgi:hypothetical protein